MNTSHSSRDKSPIGFGILVLILILGAVAGLISIRSLIYFNQRVVETHQAIFSSELLLSLLKDAETGQRGYLLTQDEEYLTPYNASLLQIEGEIEHLNELSSRDVSQLKALRKLEQIARDKLAELARTIDLNKGGRREEALRVVRDGAGKELMDQFRSDLTLFQNQERLNLKLRDEENTATSRLTMFAILGPATVAIALSIITRTSSRRFTAKIRKAAEDNFEGRQRLQVTLESIGDAVITTDREGAVTDLNAVAQELTGWSKSTAYGQPLTTVFDIVEETTRKTVNNPALRALQEGVIVGLANHTILISKDGTERPIDDSAAPIRNIDGEVIGSVLIFRDITERKNAERELREFEAQFRQTLMEVAIPTLLHADDDQIILVNKAWSEVSGYTHEDIPTISEWTRRAYGDRGSAAKDYMEKQFEATARVDNGEWELRTSKGEMRVWHFYSTPVGMGQQGRRLLVSNGIDVTDSKRNVETLKQRELELRDAQRLAHVGNWTWTPIGDVKTDSEELFRIFGLDPQRQSFPVFEKQKGTIYTEESWMRIKDAFAGALENGDGFELDLEAFRVQDKIWVTIRAEAILREDRKIEGLRGTIQDITSRKVQEAVQKQLLSEVESERRLLDAILDALPIGVAIADETGKLTRMNRANTDLWGTPSLHTGSIGEYTEWVGFWPQTGKRIEAHEWAMARAITYGEFVAGELVEIQRFDDKSRRLMINTGAPIRDRENRIVGGVVAQLDITERARAEERLRISEERLRMLFDSMDEGFCVIDLIYDATGHVSNYRLIEINSAFERHSGLRNVVGQTAREFLPDLEAFWYETFGRIARTGQAMRFVHQIASLGNRWFDVYAYRLGDQDSHKIALLLTDITARILAERERENLVGQLQEQDRRKDEFLATLAHELRNPLAPLRNGLQLMKLTENDPQIARQTRTMMDRQLDQMVHLIDDLMDLSRINRGKLELRRTRVALDRILQQAIETSRPLIEAGGHELSLTIPDQTIYVNADLTRLAQVFANLLNNSSKYTDQGGKIHITVTLSQNSVNISVKDNGIGIPTEMLPKIFEIFTQVDRSLEKSQGGLGIGLSLVKRLVEMHGGVVAAYSDGHNLGSDFVVQIPVLEVETSASAIDGEQEPVLATTLDALTILIADDNVDAANSLALVLDHYGCIVQAVHDGEHAIEMAASIKPDIIFLDIGMPRLNGYDTCRRIRSLPDGNRPRIVALTGWGQEDDRKHSKASGFDQHLVKPVDISELEQLLKRTGK